MDDNGKILAEALAWTKAGRKAALATVVSSWGSSPRAAGSRLAVDGDGHFIGSVSGGCVEGEVLASAEDVLASGRPALLEFGVSDEKAWSVGLACGGAIRIFVEPVSDLAFFDSIAEGLARGEATVSLVDLASGARTRAGAAAFDAETIAAIRTAQAGGRDALIEMAQGRFFLEFWRPPLRLFIIGAVHIAQALAPIAAAAGYDVVIIDPRDAFATPERFAGFSLRAEWPDEVFSTLRIDERCALVALSHEPRIDDPGLIAALRGRAFYIGALGSRTTAEKRRDRLRGRDFSEADLARIHGPIGLPIGAANPAEIAIAIAAEMTAALRKGQNSARALSMGSAAE
jgi:xanthine dehydrogenase accessory factor